MAKKKAAKKSPKKAAKKSPKKAAKKKTVVGRITKGMSKAVEAVEDMVTRPFSSRGKKKAKKKSK